MSKFSETLKNLLDENNLSYKSFATDINISASRITDYVNGNKLPSVKNLIKIADYFKCSADFLLGRDYENPDKQYIAPVPFNERLLFLKNFFNFTNKQIYGETEITKSRYFDWLSGKRQPSVDNIIKLADLFDCSVDFVIGREN